MSRACAGCEVWQVVSRLKRSFCAFGSMWLSVFVVLSVSRMDNVINLAQDIDKMLANALVISEYDRSVYVKRYGEDRVSFIELQAEVLAEPDHNIQACINIAYDKGFTDCIAMVQRVLKRYDVQGVTTP